MKKQRIYYKEERIVLSDILPYEVPPFFNNQQFYLFLKENKIQFKGQKLHFSKTAKPIVKIIIKIIFGLDNSNNPIDDNPLYNYFKINSNSTTVTIPYRYRIKHRNKFRLLSVIHPINQLELVPFYHKYASTIIYNCNKSNYSIRRPSKIATIKYFKDETNKKKSKGYLEIDVIETTDKEYTSLKTYFSYREYSNIYKFYESYTFQNAEKKFDFLMKFDITRCFDSVYTHTLPWALSNKSLVKENIESFKKSFGGQFDTLMQKMNYNETNGIVIGPEFSRIFSELILQQIDKNVELESYNKYKIKNKVDYIIYRYVDDYFLFYNDEKTKDILFNCFIEKLQDYKFSLNDNKTIVYSKPLITNITVAKEKVKDLISETYFLHLQEIITSEKDDYSIFSAKDIITRYKSIIHQTEITYGDIQNYFLAAILNKTISQIKKIQNIQQSLLNVHYELAKANSEQDEIVISEKLIELKTILDKGKKRLFKNIINIIELVLFIYSVLPSVSYSIKIASIFLRILDYVKNQESTKKRYVNKAINETGSFSNDIAKYFGCTFDEKHQIFKQIFDGIVIVCNKRKDYESGQDGKWYLLSVINELGEHYNLSEKHIIDSINLEINDWDYFNIISVLGYIKNNPIYFNLRKKIIERVELIFHNYNKSKSEHVLLAIDLISSPFFYLNEANKNEYKIKLLRNMGIYNRTKPTAEIEQDIEEIKKMNNGYFYQWKNRNFAVELNTKKGHFVY